MSFQLLSETYITPNLIFKKSLLIAKNIEYIDLREVNYSKDSPPRPIFTKNGLCFPSVAAGDLKDALEDSLTVKNRLCVRNHRNQFFIFVQTIDPNSLILTIKRQNSEFSHCLFLTRLASSAIIELL